MMQNIRNQQLRKLITESFGGSQSSLSAQTGVSLAQLGQYLGGYRNMGEKTARKIERGCGKPIGWLDSPNMDDSTPPQHHKKIPLISMTQVNSWSAGIDSLESIDTTDYVLTELDSSENSFALEISEECESKLSKFHVGDIVIIDPNVSPSPGDIVTTKNKNKLIFSRYQAHKNNENTQCTDSISANTIGTVIEHRRYRTKSGHF